MKSFSLLLAAALAVLLVLALASSTHAQTSYKYYYKDKSAISGYLDGQAAVVKAYADVLSAQAQMVKARSEANLNNAKALEALQNVRGQAIENDLKSAVTFYEKRKLYANDHAAQQLDRPSAEDVIRYSKASVPERPTNYQLNAARGKIYWPSLLQRHEFLERREQLEALFARRASQPTGPGSEISYEAQEAVAEMRDQLRDMVEQVPPMDYVAVRRFLDSLSHEATLPPRVPEMIGRNQPQKRHPDEG